LEKEIEEIGKELERTGDEKTLHEYTDRLHELETLGGYNIHHKTEEVLQGLGFSNTELQKPYKQFSGGWRMRVLLAKMILQQPDLLLLHIDESKLTSPVKFELAPSINEEFPHIYGRLNLDAVTKVENL